MKQELTVCIDADVYEALRRVANDGKADKLVEALLRTYLMGDGYRQLAEAVQRDEERSIVELLAMPDAVEIDFEPARLEGELYRKSELI